MEATVVMKPVADSITIGTMHPLLVTGGEVGLQEFCAIVRSQWQQGKDFIIDLTAVTNFPKATIEFLRE